MSEVADEGDFISRPPWLDWVEKNSEPKRHYWPRPKRELTRFQKRGPMTRRDWVRFYHWAAKNAIPKELPEPPPLPPPPELPGKRKKMKPKSLNQLLERIAELCEPRNPREKYEYPPKPVYPYAPKIHPKEPAKKDKGRPFKTPTVPKVFQHIDLEAEFWNAYRFPIIRGALKYRPSANMLKLAKPKIVPPLNPHCPYPEKKPEYVAPRKKMTYRQWLEHSRRLEYLAKPVLRPTDDFEGDFFYY